jgi:hypothetical protein
VVEGLRETPPVTRADLWVESVDQMVFGRGEQSSEGWRGVGFRGLDGFAKRLFC